MARPEPAYVAAISSLSKDIRDKLPISIRSGGAVLSYYRDDYWDFSPYIHPNNVPDNQQKIVFSCELPDCRLFTDPEHAKLLESSKRFLYMRLLYKHPRSGRYLAHSGLTTRWRELRLLLKWMVENNYRCFASLTPSACLAYVQNIKSMPIVPATMVSRLSILEDLYQFRNHLTDALSEHPWPTQTAASLVGYSNQKAGQGKTEKIPDRLTKKLVKGALRYVEGDYGEQLLACRNDYMCLNSRRSDLKNKAISTHLEVLGLRNWQEVKREIRRMYISCYVVIDMFSGLRDSEMGSLTIDCYTEHEGWDDEKYGWIKGVSYKMMMSPVSVEWMVPPVVRKAILLAEMVSAPIRKELEDRIIQLKDKLQLDYIDVDMRAADEDALCRFKHCRKLLFINKVSEPNYINPWNNARTNGRLKEFAKYLDLRVESADLDQVINAGRINIKVGDIWPLAPHQFRKTFAVYVARNIFGDVLYLRKHFGHWSLDMTLYYSVSELNFIDDSLFEEVLTERDELQAVLVGSWLDIDEPLTGNGSKRIKEYRKRKDVRVVKSHLDLGRKLSEGFYIRATGHSWCTSENCTEHGLYDILQCEEDGNRLIDRSHLPVWKGIRKQQIELLQMDDLGDPMWQRAKDHLRHSEKVLRELGEEVDSFLVPPMPSELRNSLELSV